LTVCLHLGIVYNSILVVESILKILNCLGSDVILTNKAIESLYESPINAYRD
jgi:hypothetical protein